MAENISRVKSYVIDASYLLAFLFPDEFSSDVDSKFRALKEGEVRFVSTTLLQFEIINSLVLAVVRHRLEIQEALRLAGDFLRLKIDYLGNDFFAIERLAINLKISAYDASYLYLAKSYKYPLLTLDKKLFRASLESGS